MKGSYEKQTYFLGNLSSFRKFDRKDSPYLSLRGIFLKTCIYLAFCIFVLVQPLFAFNCPVEPLPDRVKIDVLISRKMTRNPVLQHLLQWLFLITKDWTKGL